MFLPYWFQKALVWSKTQAVSYLWLLCLALSCTAWNDMTSAWLCTEILSGTPRMIMMRRGKQTFLQLLQHKAIGKKWFQWVSFWSIQLWKIFLFVVWLTFFSSTGELGSPGRHTWALLQCCLCVNRARPAEPGHENPTKGWRLGLFKGFYNYSVGYITWDNL